MQILACGSNVYGQLHKSESLSVPSPTPILPRDLPNDGDDWELFAISDCQTVLRCRSNGRLSLHGFQADVLRLPSADTMRKLLGRSHFTAYINNTGRIVELAEQQRTTTDTFVDATIDGHGRILAIRADLALALYPGIEHVFANTHTVISIDHTLSSESRLYSGAAHFVIHVSSDILYTLGSDNRFFQLGHPTRPSDLLARQLGIFEGGSSVRKIACGDLHSAVVTEDGALYLFGSDAQCQCGGHAGTEPTLVEFNVQEGQEQPDVLDVACGSRHTLVLTDQGVYATGSNHVGQLGLGDTDPRTNFTKVLLCTGELQASGVQACAWTTFFTIPPSPVPTG